MEFRVPTDTPISWTKYKGMVRAQDQESLIRVAAATTAGMLAGSVPEGNRFGLTPWAIADVARTSLVWGGFSWPAADITALARLANAYTHVDDEFLNDSGQSHTALLKFLARMTLEQFPMQLGTLPELARAKLLFDSGRAFPAGHVPETMTGNWFAELYGYSLDDYLGGVFLAYASALSSGGAYEPSWLSAIADSGAFGALTSATIEGVFRDHLAGTTHEFKIRNRHFQDAVADDKKKYSFNPLRDRPFLTDLAEVPIAPVAHTILGKVSPSSIYYTAIQTHGQAFARDLGHIFEAYVGDQLELLQARLWPEVAYKKSKSLLDSTDWFLELRDWLVLVECKSARPVESVRLGDSTMLDSLDLNIGKAIRQINRSHEDFPLIRSQEPSVPSKRHFGLVVTLESFFANNNPVLRTHLQRAEIPTAIVSAAELETLTTLTADELNDALTLAAEEAEPSTEASMSEGIKAAVGRVNRLVEHAFNDYAFMRQIGNTATDSPEVE